MSEAFPWGELKRLGLTFAEKVGQTELRLCVERAYGATAFTDLPMQGFRMWPKEKLHVLMGLLKEGLGESIMTRGDLAAELDDAIKLTTGKPGPFPEETRIAAITQDSLETIELMIALEVKFDKSFDDMLDGPVHSGTYGELLDFLCRAHGFTKEPDGEYNPPYPHGWGKNHRDYRD